MSSPHRFVNKTAVITGASTGLGFATAQALVEEGARVIITGQDEARLTAAARQLGPNATPVRADVRKLEDLDALTQRARELFERVDVLFANAGIGRFLPIEQMDEAAFDELFNVNVKGMYFTVQKLVGLLKPGSSIILNSSALNAKGAASAGVYIATKAAVRSLARSLAAELGPRGIRVNSLSPGMVITEFQKKSGMSQEGLECMSAIVTRAAPLARLGQVREIARAALFLASDESSYMTATDFVVDGGFMNV